MTSEERRDALLERRAEVDERSCRIWAKSEFVDFPVFRVPTELLVLNAQNRRFRAEAQDVVKELGRELDAESDEDSISVLLLDKNPRVAGNRVVGSSNKDTDALVDDWNRRKQEQPLWVRPDGLVSNGNRRLAMLRRLQAQGTEGYDWVDVVFMDEADYDDDTLFDMEAREQLTEGLKVRYTKMNGLLTLRDAADKQEIKWNDPRSIKDVAERIRHLANNNASYAKVQLQAVKYMTDYLEWRGTPGDFGALKEMVERFRDLGKNMDWVTTHDPDREAAMLQVCFTAIEAGAKHEDLRAVRGLAHDDLEAFDSLVEEVEALAAEPDGEEVVAEPPSSTDEEVDDDEESESPDDVGPRSARQDRIARTVRGAANAWRAQNDPPEVRVRAAASELTGLDPVAALATTSGVTRAQVIRSIGEIISWAAEAEKALAEAEQGGG